MEDVVAEARTILRARSFPEASWWLGPSATPSDLAERLIALGLVDAERPDHEPRTTAMALVREPPAAPEVLARRIRSIEEFAAANEVALEAFGSSEHRREAVRGGLEDDWRREQQETHAACFAAFLGDEIVGFARSVYFDDAVLLVGGSVRPDARGRGAYRALVRARWDDAVARGTPALFVHAGKMSRPILERVGFVPMFESRILLDELA